MKICTKCGAYNSDDRIFCVDCNEKLGDKLSAFAEQQMRDNLDDKIEKMYNRKDPLYVSTFDKIMGTVSLIGILSSLIFIIVCKFSQRSFNYLWIGIVFFLLACIEAFVPKITWAIEKLRLSFFINNADDTEPSEFYTICRRAAIAISVAVGFVILAVNFINLRHPPVRKYISDIANTESVAISSHSKDYIDANPKKWQKIINSDDYAVEIFISELEKAKSTGLEEILMMDAIAEISGKKDLPCTNKDEFLFAYYYTYGWKIDD